MSGRRILLPDAEITRVIELAQKQGIVIAGLDVGRNHKSVLARAKRIGIARWRIPSGRHSGRKIVGFDKGKPVYEHRVIAAKKLGRKLTSDEIAQ